MEEVKNVERLAIENSRIAKDENSKNEYGKTLISLLEHISLSERLPISVKIIDDKQGLKKRINKIVNFRNRSIWWSIQTCFIYCGAPKSPRTLSIPPY